MKRLWPLVVLGAFLLSGCGGSDRPEGVVERWLISLNQGRAGEPEKYAPERLSQQILPHWEDRDPGDLDVIEVGKGRTVEDHAAVPFRIERTSGAKLDGVAVVLKVRGEWQLNNLRLGERSLRVPSEGGEHIGQASAGAWIIAIGISAGLMILVAGLMALTPKPMPLPTRPSGS